MIKFITILAILSIVSCKIKDPKNQRVAVNIRGNNAVENQFQALMQEIKPNMTDEELVNSILKNQLEIYASISDIDADKEAGEVGRCIMISQSALPELAKGTELSLNGSKTAIYSNNRQRAANCQKFFRDSLPEYFSTRSSDISISFYSYSF